MASNFLVTLVGLAGQVLDEAVAGSLSREIDDRAGAAALQPLVRGTLRNLERTAPMAALTGPIARGDEQTIATHLDALRAHHPGLLPAYAALAAETVRLAARADRLPPAAAERLLDRLNDALEARESLRAEQRNPNLDTAF